MEQILSETSSLNMWFPETIDLIFETQKVDFMVSAEESSNLRRVLTLNGVNVETMIEDAGELIQNEKKGKKNVPISEKPLTEYLDMHELDE